MHNLEQSTLTPTVYKKTAAVIVLYFPSENLLARLLTSITDPKYCLIVVDNTPSKELSCVSESWFLSNNFNVTYNALGSNYGIAKAQNIGVELAIKGNCDHVIFFDQDSCATPNMIEKLFLAEQELLSDGFKVGALGPVFIDEKTGDYGQVIRYGNFFVNRLTPTKFDIKPIPADYLIASGSLIRTAVLQEVGLMHDELFIDWVDIEWGLRAANLGYQNFVIPKATMLHSIGDEFIDVGMRKVNLHNDIRNYYIVRNASNLLLNPKMGRKFRTNVFFKIPAYILFYSIHSERKFMSLKLLFRACIDGFTGKLGKAF